jgi:hypothetical protein
MEVPLKHPASLCLVALICLTGDLVPPAADCPRRLLGVWEYRQKAGQGYDDQGERLELSCRGDSIQGLYFGLEREGEHGLFYSLVEMADLKVDPNGELSFTVPERDLFHERPKNLQEVKQKKLASAGVTRDELYLRGRLKEEKLIVACTSKGSSCPDTVMVFHKGQWKPE